MKCKFVFQYGISISTAFKILHLINSKSSEEKESCRTERLQGAKKPQLCAYFQAFAIRYLSCSPFAQHPWVTEFISVKEEAELGKKAKYHF